MFACAPGGELGVELCLAWGSFGNPEEDEYEFMMLRGCAYFGAGQCQGASLRLTGGFCRAVGRGMSLVVPVICLLLKLNRGLFLMVKPSHQQSYIK